MVGLVVWGGMGGLPAGDGAETGWASHRGAGEGVAGRRASGGPSGGWPATCRVNGAKALVGGSARIQVPQSNFGETTPDAARRQRRDGRHGGRPALGVAQRSLHLHSNHTAGGSQCLGGRGGGSGAPVRPALPGMPPAPAPAPPCRPQGLHKARCRGHHARVGPRSRLQPPPAPLTAGRWRAAESRLSPGASHGTPRRAAGAPSKGSWWQGEASWGGACAVVGPCTGCSHPGLACQLAGGGRAADWCCEGQAVTDARASWASKHGRHRGG